MNLTRKYICDNCGDEFEDADEMTTLFFVELGDPTEIELEVGDYCEACTAKIHAKIKEGVS